MNYRKRQIYGYVFDGTRAVRNAFVDFIPTAKVGYTNSHFIVDRPVRLQTDNDGFYDGELWCDEDSNVAINWNVFLPKDDNGEPQKEYVKNFSLAYDDGSPIEVGYLVALSSPAPPPGDLLYQAVDQRIALKMPKFWESANAYWINHPLVNDGDWGIWRDTANADNVLIIFNNNGMLLTANFY